GSLTMKSVATCRPRNTRLCVRKLWLFCLIRSSMVLRLKQGQPMALTATISYAAFCRATRSGTRFVRIFVLAPCCLHANITPRQLLQIRYTLRKDICFLAHCVRCAFLFRARDQTRGARELHRERFGSPEN